MKKKFMDLTIEEAVYSASVGWEIEPNHGPVSDSMRDALKMVVDFKLSQKQDEINKRLITLTKRLVWLTIAVVVLTLVLIFKA